MPKGSRGGQGRNRLEESDKKPKGGGNDGNGNWNEPVTVYPFNIAPKDLAESLGKKGRPIAIEKSISGANPYYGSGTGVEFNENCQRAVAAFEARMRGYDVVALPTYKGDTLPTGNEWAKAFKDYKTDYIGDSTPLRTQKNLEAKMMEYGNGSRAIVSIPGHAFNVVNSKGKIWYVDAQSNTVYNSKNVFSRVGSRSSQISIIRTDNLSFSEDARKSFTPVTDIMRTIAKNKGI